MNNAVVCLLFLGLLLYLCAPVIRLLHTPKTAVAEAYSEQTDYILQGLIVREETLIPVQQTGAVPVAADGQAVAAGSTVAVSGDETIPAPAAGIFVWKTDGFEHLTADMLSQITPAGVDRLLHPHSSDISHSGKIISGNGWMLAATAEAPCGDTLQEGQFVKLTAQTEDPFDLTAAVVHISSEENGRCAVIFRCTDHLQTTAHLRQLTVSLPQSRIEGVRVPSEAVYADEVGSFIYKRAASGAEKLYVTILSEEADFTIVSKDSSAHTLRAGDTIIISAPDLEEAQ